MERLARYVSRPPVATARLSLTRGGNVRYALKTPYRDGTTHVIFEPEEFMVHIPVRHPFGAAYGRANRQSCRFVIARLVALVPKPRAHLTRYHGLFAPASPDRAQVVPSIHAAAATERDQLLGPAGVALQRILVDCRWTGTWRQTNGAWQDACNNLSPDEQCSGLAGERPVGNASRRPAG